MKKFIIITLVTLGFAARSVAAEQKPNILVILSDDQGYADVGFQGNKEIRTPHLDRLAREGLRCTSGYVTHPYCSPSRAGLLTGRCQMRFGHERNPYYEPNNHREGLPLTETLLPEYLANAGYATGWIGKWHLGAAPEFWPEKRGFKETFGFIGGGHVYLNWKVDPAKEYFVPICRNGKPVEVKEHLTLAFGREAGAFIKRHKNEPWFLYLAFNAPHTPHQPTAERLEKFAHIKDPQRRAYLAQISLMDDAIGETLGALRESGQAERTLVFFFSDNGGAQFAGVYDNTPLRGTKGTTYEGGVRVPFVVSWPNKLPAGKDYTQTVSSLDVFATALACAGAPMPTDRPHDGVNLIPFLTGENTGNPHPRLCWREVELGQWGIRDDALKLVRRTHQTGVKHGHWIKTPLPRQSEELYDLVNDIHEDKNLAGERADDLHRLDAALDEWQKHAAPLAFTGVKGKETPAPGKASGTGATAPVVAAAVPAARLPKPTPAQAAWQDLDFGILFCFDQRIYEDTRAEYTTPAKVHANPQAYADQLNPRRLDTDQWLAVAKSMGANHAIFTAKHWLGFCLWQSEANPYSMKSIRWQDGKGDLVKNFTDSCRTHGLSAGIFTEASEDIRLKVHAFKVTKDSPLTQEEYDRMVTRELEELCTKYGPLCELWYDMREGPYTAPFRTIISKHQPNAVFYGPDYRWGGGREDGEVSYPCWATFSWVPLDKKLLRTGDVKSTNWCPARADAPLRYRNGCHYWYWHPNCENGIATLEQLQQMYYGSVGRNAKLIIGLTPDRDGLIPAADAARCKEFGAWLEKTFGGPPLAETSGKGNELTLEIPATVKAPVTHIILQEDIKNGEHVREYVVEAEVAGAWKQVTIGSCIGHKRIEKIEPCDARKFRLRITNSIAEAEIRAFSLR